MEWCGRVIFFCSSSSSRTWCWCMYTHYVVLCHLILPRDKSGQIQVALYVHKCARCSPLFFSLLLLSGQAVGSQGTKKVFKMTKSNFLFGWKNFLSPRKRRSNVHQLWNPKWKSTEKRIEIWVFLVTDSEYHLIFSISLRYGPQIRFFLLQRDQFHFTEKIVWSIEIEVMWIAMFEISIRFLIRYKICLLHLNLTPLWKLIWIWGLNLKHPV